MTCTYHYNPITGITNKIYHMDIDCGIKADSNILMKGISECNTIDLSNLNGIQIIESNTIDLSSRLSKFNLKLKEISDFIRFSIFICTYASNLFSQISNFIKKTCEYFQDLIKDML